VKHKPYDHALHEPSTLRDDWTKKVPKEQDNLDLRYLEAQERLDELHDTI